MTRYFVACCPFNCKKFLSLHERIAITEPVYFAIARNSAAWLQQHRVPVSENVVMNPTATCLVCDHSSVSEPAVPSITVAELAAARQHNGRRHVLVDCREVSQFGICSLRGSINLPLQSIVARPTECVASIVAAAVLDLAMAAATSDESSENVGGLRQHPLAFVDVYVLCRRGVDSVEATRVRPCDAAWPTTVKLIRQIADTPIARLIC